MDTVHIKCVRCNWDNYRTLLWFKDSTNSSKDSTVHPEHILYLE